MLKGKCKIEFEKWYILWLRTERGYYLRYSDEQLLSKFYDSPFSMQWGVYLEFFDSVGYLIETEYLCENVYTFDIFFPEITDFKSNDGFNSRQQAQQKAIEKANEIFNGKLL